MRLFISHATEDKASFVRPLAEALRQHFEVWYDEYELTIGDSLLTKINEGLTSSEYGVVVLSPSFFRKKWTRSELDALFALEGTSRKIILPIWKEVSVEDVRKFSPILAGRLGAIASDGIPKVVNEIRRAIEISNRTREIGVIDPIIQEARKVDQTLVEQDLNERLSHSEEGVSIVKESFKTFCISLQTTTEAVTKGSQALRFRIDKQPHLLGEELIVRTNNGMALNILFHGLGENWTHETKLAVVVTKRNLQRLGFDQKADNLRELKFRPFFKLQNQLTWIDESNRKSYSAKELSDYLLEILLAQVQRLNP